MAKRKRLTPATILDQGAQSPALETKSGYPFGVAPTRAPIAQVAAEAATQAALDEVAGEMQSARKEGRMVLALPLEAIRADHLVRDRMVLDASEMEVLKVSLQTRGQQTPIEVVDLGDGAYGLISGLRRLTALKSLHAETDEARFAQVQALIKPLESASDSYIAMVEENEIRANLSFYERARLATEAARLGLYPTPQRAVQALFANAASSKRSKITAFLGIHDALDGAVRFPAAIPEKVGLALAAALEGDAGLKARLRERLRRQPDTNDAAAERKVLDHALKAATQKADAGQGAPAAKPTRQKIADGITLETRQGRVVVSGKGVTEALQADLAAWLSKHLTH